MTVKVDACILGLGVILVDDKIRLEQRSMNPDRMHPNPLMGALPGTVRPHQIRISSRAVRARTVHAFTPVGKLPISAFQVSTFSKYGTL